MRKGKTEKELKNIIETAMYDLARCYEISK